MDAEDNDFCCPCWMIWMFLWSCLWTISSPNLHGTPAGGGGGQYVQGAVMAVPVRWVKSTYADSSCNYICLPREYAIENGSEMRRKLCGLTLNLKLLDCLFFFVYDIWRRLDQKSCPHILSWDDDELIFRCNGLEWNAIFCNVYYPHCIHFYNKGPLP